MAAPSCGSQSRAVRVDDCREADAEHHAVTLADRLQLGFLANPDAVPQVDRLAAYTVQAFAEVQRALAAVATAEHASRRKTAKPSNGRKTTHP